MRDAQTRPYPPRKEEELPEILRLRRSAAGFLVGGTMAAVQQNGYGGRQVLITGAAGFIGARLGAILVERGAHVHGTWRNREPEDAEAIRWHRVDLADEAAVRRTLEAVAPDVVFHLASHVAGSRAPDLVPLTFRDNLVSTLNLLSAVTAGAGGRLVLTGSLEEPVPGSPDAPSSPYAAAKWAATGYARMFHLLYGTAVRIARVFMVYGPGQRDERKLVPYTIRAALSGEAPSLSGGTRPVDWIYVDDVVEALLALGAIDALDPVPVDVGSGEVHTVGDVAKRICRMVDPSLAPRRGELADRPHEQVRVADIKETRRRLGWSPRVGLDQGLRETISWYRDHPATT